MAYHHEKVVTTAPGYGAPPPGPVQGEWAPQPLNVPNCPPGLEYLSMIDQLLIKQQIELLEVLLGCETRNKYKIKNSMGQQVYFALEDTDCCTRNCLGPIRPFDMKITDNAEHEIIHLYRPCRCDSCCFPCCLQELAVMSPLAGNMPLGYVKQEWSILTPKYVIENANHEEVLKIRGPICTCRCCADVDFKILALDEQTVVGHVRKQWGGLLREAFTDADNFSVTFPMDLDVQTKATVLGAAFLIDYMYFEVAKNQN